MKILIIRFSSIGDIVLTTPVIRALKLQLDDVEIHYCTKEEYLPLLVENPYLDKILTLNDGLVKLIRQLRKERYDEIIDLHNNLRSLLIKASVQGKKTSFRKLNLVKWVMVNFKIDKLPNAHIVDRYIEPVVHLGVKKDGQGLDYFIPEKDNVEIDWLPETHRNGFVAYAIGGKFETKKLPVKRMIELCDRINKPIVLLGGEEDVKNGNEIQVFFEKTIDSQPYEKSLLELGKKTIIFNGCGKFNINQSASLLKQASHVFSHDTGLMHIASAFRKQIFSIWGNTIPAFGMFPYKTKFLIFENKKIKCRPCSKLGFDKCPKGHFKCMNDLVFDFYLP
ncbi:MAG: glycosyltransferase family 9 protein [Cyclobacteriaceae bacterium]